MVGLDQAGRTSRKRYEVIFLCFIASFICYIDRVNISVAIIPMQEEFQWSATLKGLVLSSFYVGYTLFQIPIGWLTNKRGGRIILGFALIWWSITTILTPVASLFSFSALIIIRILMGAGETGTFPASYNLFSRWVPKSERSRAVAFMVSGIPLGTLFALTTTGFIIEKWGWESVFYLFGGLGLLFGIVWFRRIYNQPEAHPSISTDELRLLKASKESVVTQTSTIKWYHLFKYKPVIALIINHFCSNWGFYVLLSWLPSYFKTVQGVNLTSAGFYAAAPWLTMFLVSNASAWVADKLIGNGTDLTLVRKSFQVIGLLGSALFLFLTKDASSVNSATILLCSSMAFLALSWSGFLPNHLDIAPQYAGLLLSITNTVGTLPGIIGVYITGYLIDSFGGSYSVVFIVAAIINVIGAVIWLFMASGKKLDFAKV